MANSIIEIEYIAASEAAKESLDQEFLDRTGGGSKYLKSSGYLLR
jgi:hypothetical protein